MVDDLGPAGFGWKLRERMRRTCHALAADGRVWLVDPVDVPGLDERVRGLGEPAAVLDLLDRHERDCAALAGRLGVPHLVAPAALPDTPFEVVPVMRARWWREVALWWPAQRALVVADALGTNAFYRTGDETAAVHPLLRVVRPPRALARLDAEHLLVGHGEGLHGPETAAAVRRAVRTARTGFQRYAAGPVAEIERGELR